MQPTENMLTFFGWWWWWAERVCARLLSALWRGCFIWFKVFQLQSGWGDICLWSNSWCRDVSLYDWDLLYVCVFFFFLNFPSTNDDSFPEKRHAKSLSPLPCVYQSHTDYMCTQLLIEWQCECTSSTNESLYYSAIMMISPFCVLHHASEGSAGLHSPQ